ncbi:lantibiotic dehydratase [Hymenobacter sp. NST-14]|uniref:lantibiotic dehydratase n=1 Tax=Hymenobacter piscis TaxID=2839984 RepID=UPI001C02EC93|nr:lantibiotic dehydratase [Hymenobacter piscis]MBT9393148.1 lantibiotic dehydratase [Hymenobacter piscis]
MENTYCFHSSLVVRMPAKPFQRKFDEKSIRRALADPALTEALYLASVSLADDAQRIQTGEDLGEKKLSKVFASLSRYYSRMSSRCTPFALFAGCGVASWGQHTHIVRSSQSARRHTRLDMHYLGALASRLAERPDVRQQLRYFPNSSLYALGEEVRYTEFRYDQTSLIHQLSAVTGSDTLLQALDHSRPGITRQALATALLSDDLLLEDTLGFVDALIEGQLLVSELEPTVTGPEFMTHVLQVLDRLQQEQPNNPLASIRHVLRAVQGDLLELDRPGSVNAPHSYEQIIQKLTALEAPLEAGKLFQTDLTYDLGGATLAESVQSQLLAAVEALTYLVPATQHHQLKAFQQHFYARYADQEVPLLEALDSESGIGYAGKRESYASLVHDLAPPAPTDAGKTINTAGIQQLLHQKLVQAERSQEYTIHLTKDELRSFAPVALPLPASLSVVFHMGPNQQLVLESVGGASAANLLGRFAHADAAIGKIVRDTTQFEQERNPDVRFAEVCHLPANRVGNILLRPHLRDLEIPYLAQSTLSAEQQTPLQDLYLSVRAGKLILRSRRLNQLIIPRLSSAHNFTRQALPIYQFLCDLQTQGFQTQLNFSWQAAAFPTKFFPRLTYEQVVLRPASWKLDAADLATLVKASPADLIPHLEIFRTRWQLPELFTLADGDNELLVDAHNPLTVRAWLDLVKSRTSIELKEFLQETTTRSPVTDASGHPYVSQFVATLLRKTVSYPRIPLPHISLSGSHVQRNFTLGSEWFYTKLYCGQQVANRILGSVIRPLTETLQAEGIIDKWFFIRYADPDDHLRVRLHLPDPANVGQVIRLVEQYLQPHLASGYVWKMQTETYCRELERYGPQTIELAEDLFCLDSRYAVALLAYEGDALQADATYWLWSIRIVDTLLDAFHYSTEQKTELLRRIKEAFAQEFRMDKSLKLQVDSKFRHHRAAIYRILELEEREATRAGEPMPLLTYHRTTAARQIIQQLLQRHINGTLEVPLDQLLGSYVHMLLNRLISSQARLHEMVIYDFLFRHYHSQQSRAAALTSGYRS